MGRLSEERDEGSQLLEAYDYDANGRRIWDSCGHRQGNHEERRYIYDSLGDDRLIEVRDASTEETIRSYDYTLDGFLSRRTDETAPGGQDTVLSYNTFGELESVQLPDGRLITYRHDVLGRRCERAVDGVVTHRYLWVGGGLLAVYDGSDELKMRFEYADSRVPVAVWVYEGGLGTRYFIAAVKVGSIRAVFDQAVAVVKTFDYDSFRNILAETNQPIPRASARLRLRPDGSRHPVRSLRGQGLRPGGGTVDGEGADRVGRRTGSVHVLQERSC